MLLDNFGLLMFTISAILVFVLTGFKVYNVSRMGAVYDAFGSWGTFVLLIFVFGLTHNLALMGFSSTSLLLVYRITSFAFLIGFFFHIPEQFFLWKQATTRGGRLKYRGE